jgi:Zn-dependent M16 (insulinase) family peptidase
MITRIQCDTGDDCAALTQCMVESGIMFQSAFNPEDAEIVRKFFDIVWRNQRGNQKNEHKRLSNITLRHNSDSIDA